jgi:hypothetical protein
MSKDYRYVVVCGFDRWDARHWEALVSFTALPVIFKEYIEVIISNQLKDLIIWLGGWLTSFCWIFTFIVFQCGFITSPNARGNVSDPLFALSCRVVTYQTFVDGASRSLRMGPQWLAERLACWNPRNLVRNIVRLLKFWKGQTTILVDDNVITCLWSSFDCRQNRELLPYTLS